MVHSALIERVLEFGALSFLWVSKENDGSLSINVCIPSFGSLVNNGRITAVGSLRTTG